MPHSSHLSLVQSAYSQLEITFRAIHTSRHNSYLGVILPCQVSTSGIVPLPLLTLLATRRVQQNLLEFVVGQLPLVATGPRELKVIPILEGVTAKSKTEQKSSKQCDEAAGESNGAKPPDNMISVSLARRRRPYGGDEGRMLVRHLFVIDHILVGLLVYLLTSC